MVKAFLTQLLLFILASFLHLAVVKAEPTPEPAPPGMNLDTPLPLLNEAAEAGNLRAQTELGVRLRKGFGMPKNNLEGVKWLQKAADKDYPEAELKLGMALFDAGDSAKETEGFNWIKKAANQNHPAAQSMLGILYQMGLGVAKDEAEAMKWFRTAGKFKEPMSVMMLAMAYGQGKGVPRDEAESEKWLRIAAEQDNAICQYLLGLGLQNHKNAQDKVEANKWFRLSAEQGTMMAQVSLGLNYQFGAGVDKDLAEAFKWLKLATDQGNEQAKIQPDLLDQLTPAQLAEGSRRAAAFKVRKSRLPEMLSEQLRK